MLCIFYHNKNKEMATHYKNEQNKNIQKTKYKWLLNTWEKFYLTTIKLASWIKVN